MTSYEIVYFIIFLSIIALASFGTGWIWFKVLHPFHERVLKWKRNSGKF